jgi:calcineurin-like phosphoesterase family protein
VPPAPVESRGISNLERRGRSPLADRFTLRILHLSDLHARAKEQDSWRRRRVLGSAWEANLEALADSGPFDLVCFTGDAAFSGRPAEFSRAGELLSATLERLGVPGDCMFLVPGNHDVDRTVEKPTWKYFRNHLGETKSDAAGSWMAGGKPPFGFQKGQREKLLARQAAYRAWVGGDLGRPSLVAGGIHPLGYRESLNLPHLPFPIHVIGLDSAWLCGDDSDAKNLRLTDTQVMRLATDENGDPLPGFRIALVHHPFDELADMSEVRRLLAERVDVVLRGHLHEPEPQLWADPERSFLQLAAGCLYENDRYPNAFQVIEAELSAEGRPSGWKLWFRGWSPRGHWYDDDSLYRGSARGKLKIFPSASKTEPPTATPSSTSLPGAGRLFVGREAELAELSRHLLRAGEEPAAVAICALQGMPGVGKTYLAEQFAAKNRGDFPGGLVRLVIDPVSPEALTEMRLLGELADRLGISSAPERRAESVRSHLRAAKALLLIENVDSAETASAVAPLARLLAGCPLLVTGRYRELGTTPGGPWRRLEVAPLAEGQSLEQLRLELLDVPIPEEDGRRLVRGLGFLPLAIHLAAGYLRRRSVDTFLHLMKERRLALPPIDAADLALQGRSTLAATFEISLQLLEIDLRKEGIDFRGFQALGFAPAGGFGTSLGAAVAGLEPVDFEELAARAEALSLLDRLAERPDRAWKLHPLLAELLRHRASELSEPALDRITGWFVERFPVLAGDQVEKQGKRWNEVQREVDALVSWLPKVKMEEATRVERAGSRYAMRNGPFSPWVTFCETALAGELSCEERSSFLWTLARVAKSAGLRHNDRA